MRAVIISRPGGPEVLEIRTVADPIPGRGQVRVRVRASALNRADVLQRRGLYPAPPGWPADVPGLEFAGEVELAGEGVRSLRVGDRVMGILGGGGHAERVVVDERSCLVVPDELGWEQAGAVPEAFLTAWDALVRLGGASAGDAVLIHAAGSGVGTAAGGIARVLGARPLALSRTPEKRARLDELGLADAVFDPSSADVAEHILAAAGGSGVAVVLDLVGAAAWPLNVRVLAPGGRLVVVGLLGGARVEVDLSAVLRKRLSVIGTVLRSRPLDDKIALTRAFGRDMLPRFRSGELRPVIGRVFPIDEVAEAHRLMDGNRTFGKIVLSLTPAGS